MHEKGRLSCARCCASYPNVSILKCDNTILGISLTMCKTCHKRFHPTCSCYTSAIRPEDKLCDRCFQNEADIVCPQCSGPSYCAQLCKNCHQTVHKDHLFSHLDHVVKIPS
ncbi:hypothetical protein ACF0H5_019764 [Mactra antiquata]